MSGIARVLLQMGLKVSGSDLKSSNLTEELKGLGAEIFLGHSSDNLAPDVDVVVVSSAISDDNPELIEAKRRGIEIVHRGHMLSLLMKPLKGVAVAGTHGKTTTSAMIATIFKKANLEPTIVVGGELNGLGSNAQFGKGEYLVAEADESDGSFLDLSPRIAIVTSIDPDVNLATEAYSDCGYDFDLITKRVQELFVKFINGITQDGLLILCGDHHGVRDILPQVKKRFITYGLDPENDLHAVDITLANYASRSRIIYNGQELGELVLNVPGVHNVQNALAAVAAGLEVGLKFEDIVRYLANFAGVKRRFQIVGRGQGLTIVDDYAHNPSKLKAAIRAAHTGDAKRVVVIFQPHRYTRTRFFQEEYCLSFNDADLLVITDIYSAGEIPLEGVSSRSLVEEIQKTGCVKEVVYAPQESDVLNFVRTHCRQGDIVLFLGAGNICKFAEDFAESLKD
ncbi:UDP-N-acetylmuramate--L-alanine ligase [bacterium]|nr:UDP-N-acetylmuramate--L-alanine ligase [bacterium]